MQHRPDDRSSAQSNTNVLDKEIENLLKAIVASPAGDDLLARIGTKLSSRERELLWAYLAQTDTHELASALGLENQSVHNCLLIIEQKLGFDSRPEMLKGVFSAILKKVWNS